MRKTLSLGKPKPPVAKPEEELGKLPAKPRRKMTARQGFWMDCVGCQVIVNRPPWVVTGVVEGYIYGLIILSNATVKHQQTLHVHVENGDNVYLEQSQMTMFQLIGYAEGREPKEDSIVTHY